MKCLGQNEMSWAPLLSENFIRDYKVKEFCGIYGPVAPPPLPTGGVVTHLPDPPPLPPGNSQVGGERVTNISILAYSMFLRTEEGPVSLPPA